MDEFLTSSSQGYLWVVGDAGVGKTAFCAFLVKEHAYICHFIRYTGGERNPVAIANLVGQLVLRYDLEEFTHSGGILRSDAITPEGFETVLGRAAHKGLAMGNPVVIVVDGLDEAEVTPGHLPWGLPDMLPEGVFVIGTYRTGYTPAPTSASSKLARIDKDNPLNRDDLREFLKTALNEETLAARLAESAIGLEAAIEILMRACGGIWVYLRYLLTELRIGTRQFDVLDDPPGQLVDYYDAQLMRWQMDDNWQSAGRPLLSSLAAAGEPVPLDCLARWTRTPINEVRRWCDVRFRSFLDVSGSSPRSYGIYHSTARDFFAGEVPGLERHARGEHLVSLAAEMRQAMFDSHNQISNYYITQFGGLEQQMHKLGADLTLASMDSGYPLKHLASHLARLECGQSLHGFLACEYQRPGGSTFNVWHAAHDHNGTLLAYLDDIAQAWRLSEKESERTFDSKEPTALGQEVRYALMNTSVIHAGDSVDCELVLSLVASGIWSIDRAFSHLRVLSDESKITETIQKLVPILPNNYLADALTVARSLTRSQFQVKALVAVAARLDDPERGALLADAMNIARSDSFVLARAWSLIDIASHLSESERQSAYTEALHLIRQYPHLNLRVTSLSSLVPHLKEPERGKVAREVLANINRVTEEGDEAARALSDIAPFLEGSERAQVLDEMFRRLQLFSEKSYQAQAMGYLVPHLGKSFRRSKVIEILDTISSIQDEYEQALALDIVAPHVPLDLVPQTLLAARAIKSEEDRAVALTAVAPRLRERERDEVLLEALAASRTLSDQDAQVTAVTTLASSLGDEEKVTIAGKLLDVVQRITHEPYRSNALIEVASLMPESKAGAIIAEAVGVARSINHPSERMEALTSLVPYLPGSESDALFEAICGMENYHARVRLMHCFLPYLREDQLDKALAAAREISDASLRVSILSSLLSFLSETEHRSILDELLAAAESLCHHEERSRAYRYIAEVAGKSERSAIGGKAVEAAHLIASPDMRAKSLSSAVSFLDDVYRDEVLSKAIDAARLINDAAKQANVLKNMASKLSPNFLDEAISIAQAMPPGETRADALGALVMQLPPARMTESLLAMPPGAVRVPAEAIMRVMRSECSTSATQILIFRAALHCSSRFAIFRILAEFGPLLENVGGSKAIRESISSVGEVCTWWP